MPPRSLTTSSRSVVAAVLGGLVVAVVAAAVARADTYRFTAAGQAAARKAVVQRNDLGSSSGWTGGLQKPDTSSAHDTCAAYPETPDRYVIGSAETAWKHTGLEIDSDADVLRSPDMVDTDWQIITSSKTLPCLRQTVAKELTGQTRLVSIARRPFAHVANRVTAYRIVLDATSQGQTVRMMADLVFFATARTEMSLVVVAPYAGATVVGAAEVRLAALLAARASV
jgi:hypothetical protein